jgi:hypothetical protein
MEKPECLQKLEDVSFLGAGATWELVRDVLKYIDDLRAENRERASKLQAAEKRLKVIESLPDDLSSAVIVSPGHVLALCDEGDAQARRIIELDGRLDQALETNRELNRRCQVYESAASQKIEDAKREGVSLSKRFARAGYTMAEERVKELESRLDPLLEFVRNLAKQHRTCELDEPDDADLDYAYDQIVQDARAALDTYSRVGVVEMAPCAWCGSTTNEHAATCETRLPPMHFDAEGRVVERREP